MNMQTPSILMHMSAYTCPTQQHSARYPVMANIDVCVSQVLPFVLHHDVGPEQFWTSRQERAEKGYRCPFEWDSWRLSQDWPCEQCWDAKKLTTTSTYMFAAVKQYANSEQLTRSKPCATSGSFYKQHAKDEQCEM